MDEGHVLAKDKKKLRVYFVSQSVFNIPVYMFNCK